MADTVAVVIEPTGTVWTANVAVRFPPAMLIEPGTDANDPLHVRFTDNPLAGAATLSVTVPVEIFPPTTDDGLNFNDVIAGGLIVKLACWVAPFNVPEIDATVTPATATVRTLNEARVAPRATDTDPGTKADVELLTNFTTAPPGGAGPDSVTMQVAVADPTTTGGDRLKSETTGGLTVNWAETCVLPTEAVICAPTARATTAVFSVNFAALCPAVTVTELGT